jgi:hypothetical protein
MTWLSWRQLRTQLTAGWVAVAAAALVFVLTYSKLPDAGPAVYDQLTASQRNLYVAGLILVAVAPALIGAFWGAPLVARELETGTHQLVWNQSVTRTRWLAVKLGVAVLAAAVAIGLLSLAITWWSGALDGATAETTGSLPARLTPVSFAMRGIVPVAYAVFGLVVGVLAGMLLRRTVPAMAVTLLVVVFAQIAAPVWLREHLAPPVRESLTLSRQTLAGIGWRGADNDGFELEARSEPGAWVLVNRLVDGAGRPVTTLPDQLAPCFPPPGPRAEPPERPDPSRFAVCFSDLAAAGYRQQLVYQPADRFWRLQWTETGVFLALSGLLAWLCFVRIRRLS